MGGGRSRGWKKAAGWLPTPSWAGPPAPPGGGVGSALRKALAGLDPPPGGGVVPPAHEKRCEGGGACPRASLRRAGNGASVMVWASSKGWVPAKGVTRAKDWARGPGAAAAGAFGGTSGTMNSRRANRSLTRSGRKLGWPRPGGWVDVRGEDNILRLWRLYEGDLGKHPLP